MYTLIGIVTSVLLALRFRKLMSADSVSEDGVPSKDVTNGGKGLDFVTNQYMIPIGQACIAYCYGLYLRFSVINAIIFILKYVPTIVFMYKFMKRIYVTSQERIKQKQIELEDIQLQIQIVNTKLCVRDAEFSERAEQLRRGAERLRLVRTRVRELIAADDTLRRALDNAAHTLDADSDLQQNSSPEQDRQFLMELLKELKYDYNLISEKTPEHMDCGEHAASEPLSEHSVYSSLSDADKQDCHVKIVRVTNVYKVAYLKHYIKQKRLRRANRQALLKKKIENIKKLLEDWQKSLNMVINSKLNVLNGFMDSRAEDTSQEAMGDYSKPTMRESSNSDSDLRNGNDACYDEYWTQSAYPNYPFQYEDVTESQASREFCDSQDFNDSSCQPDVYQQQQYERSKMSDKLSTLLEETKSQILFEDSKSNEDEDSTCQDLIDL